MSDQTVDVYLDELLAPVREAADAANRSTPVPLAVPAPAPAVVPPAPAPDPAPAAAGPRPGPAPAAHAADARAATPVPPAPARAPASGSRWLRATVGRDSYGFELLRVQEVIRASPVIAMRGTGAAVLGVMNLRGRVVPVCDLATWLGTGRVAVDEHARIIVLERDDELVGVLVSTVENVAPLAREQIEPPLAGSDPGGTLGIARVGPSPTVLLDADALFG